MLRRENGRGVVMSVDGDWAIVMSPDGEFRRLRARPAWQVGDDVLLAAERSPAWRALPWLAPLGAAAAAAAVTFAVMSSASPGAVHFYVDITGAHQVKLAVSQAGLVISAVSEDGHALPVRIRPGEPVGQAVEAVARAVGAGTGSLYSKAVVVNAYAVRGAKAPLAVNQTVEMAANAVGATFCCAETASLTRASTVVHVHHQSDATTVGRQGEWAMGDPAQPRTL